MKYTIQKLNDPTTDISCQNSKFENFFKAFKEEIKLPLLVEEFPCIKNPVKEHNQGLMKFEFEKV